MAEITHRFVEANGIRFHVAEAGQGPLVLLCHGFPETWYSWRHQLRALAEAGFHAVAPDMRGYGRTDQPEAIEDYTLLHLVGDVVGLVAALGVERAAIVGHDWGAPVAWTAALLRPDVFRAVAALSVPLLRRGFGFTTAKMPQTKAAQFYMLYFQQPGVAEAELERDPRATLRSLLFSGSGDAPQRPPAAAGKPPGMVPRGGGFLSRHAAPDTLPAWLTEADVDAYARDFARTGFRGGLNWYRNIDRNWALLAPFDGLKVAVPALYVAGERDTVVKVAGAGIPAMRIFAPQLRDVVMLPGCGHWTQQERPEAVNAALLGFLRGLP